MKNIFFIFLFYSCFAFAQQTIIYTQNVFNKAGMNPAAAGTDINQEFSYACGMNRQWTAFDQAPKSNFANFSLTIRPPRSYHYWQNVGFYIDTDQHGVMSNRGVYVNYSIHLLLRKNLIASFGVYGGARKFLIQTGSFDPNDPAIQKSNFFTFTYPDIIPGFRLSNKKFFFGIAARQISTAQLKDFQKHQIGSPSKLNTSLFIDFGRIIPLNDKFLLLPSITVNAALVGAPAADVNIMVYYANVMGFGLALRNGSFLSAIYQVRILKNLSVGLCYSYSLNNARVVAPNSYEIMIGMTPMGLSSKFTGRHSIARCPALEF
ncbi:MAG: PorP/SprF family type IX secretion system membrane protein [Bacteroidetes bacterium]|nr:PorP/SprF family type IX secretion system membrane protein [Bacteroidota bacterium]